MKLAFFARSVVWILILCGAVGLGAFTETACAQSTASISGVVTDSTGAAIPQAKVILINTLTGVMQPTMTNSSGAYAIPNVHPGHYSIEVTRDGFRSINQTGITLLVAQAARFNFTMAVGAVTQTVTVSSAANSVSTTTSTLGTVITRRSVNDLPLNGRNFTQLLTLTPGVSRISTDQNAGGGGGISGNAIGSFTFPAVNGQRNRSNMFLLDGVNDLGSYFSTYNYEPIVDDIQEFKVQSHSGLAQYGGVTGGIVTVVSKSGTNQIHGSLWEFVRNSDFDASDYFLRSVNPLRQNQFGVSVGGPVVLPRIYDGRNKTFFFFAYEGFRRSEAAQSLVTTPTVAELGGDFSDLLAQGVTIYNPYSINTMNGKIEEQVFPGNKIPTSLISPGALRYAKALFPVPNATGLPGGRNLIDTTPSSLDDDNYSGRIDQAFGTHDLMFGRVSYFNEPASGSGGFPGLIKATTVHGYNIAVHEEHIFGPSAILEAFFGRNLGYATVKNTFPGAPADFPQQLIGDGFSPKYIAAFPHPIVPLIQITGYLGVGTGTNTESDHQFANTYEYGANFTKTLGRHTIKVGGSVATNNFDLVDVEAAETTTTFQTSDQAKSGGKSPTGDALASFLLGLPASADWRDTHEVEHGGYQDGAYAQDQFQVTPRLELNFGVRWDVSIWPALTTPGPGGSYFGDLDLNNGTYIINALPPACSATRGQPCIPGGALPANVVVSKNSGSLHNTDWSNWQPRIGLAFHPLRTTTITVGYGRYYDNWNGTTQLAQDTGGTWPSVGILSAPVLNTGAPTATIGDPLGQGTGTMVYPSATPFTNAGTPYNPNLKTPYADEWNAGVEQELGSSTVLTLVYAGSHSGRLDIHALSNTAKFPAPGNAAEVASRRQFPYIVATNYDDSIGNSNYHSLQATLNRMTKNGLTYLLSYTWSKSIDTGCSGIYGGASCLIQNIYDIEADRSVSSFDLPNMFSGSVVYQLPFGRRGGIAIPGGRFVNGAFGGWSVNAIASFTSGTPYSVKVNGDIANTGNSFVQANLIGDPTPAHRSPNEWINPAAFAAPPRYTFGTFGRNALRSDWFRDFDASVFKSFPLVRDSYVEFRASAFNALNSVVFAAPTATVGSKSFGTVGGLGNTPREMQFAVKVVF